MAILPENHSAPFEEAVILAFGGNLPGDYRNPRALLEAALSHLPEIGMRIVGRSRPWRSSAWPDPSEPEYINIVILVETKLDPHEVLAAALDLERRFGRQRERANAPRTLDVDLIAHGQRVIDAPGLILPHPRAHQRRFVMGPLAEIAPGWRHPVLGLTAKTLFEAAEVGGDARPTEAA